MSAVGRAVRRQALTYARALTVTNPLDIADITAQVGAITGQRIELVRVSHHPDMPTAAWYRVKKTGVMKLAISNKLAGAHGDAAALHELWHVLRGDKTVVTRQFPTPRELAPDLTERMIEYLAGAGPALHGDQDDDGLELMGARAHSEHGGEEEGGAELFVAEVMLRADEASSLSGFAPEETGLAGLLRSMGYGA